MRVTHCITGRYEQKVPKGLYCNLVSFYIDGELYNTYSILDNELDYSIPRITGILNDYANGHPTPD